MESGRVSGRRGRGAREGPWAGVLVPLVGALRADLEACRGDRRSDRGTVTCTWLVSTRRLDRSEAAAFLLGARSRLAAAVISVAAMGVVTGARVWREAGCAVAYAWRVRTR